MSLRQRIAVIVGIALTVAAPVFVFGHGGGLDSYGCHHDRKRGGYHCHRGPFAGRSFESQADMLKEQATRSETPPKPERVPRPNASR